MSLPVPLMFINGPPVYERVPMKDEESTSIFVKYSDEETPTMGKLPTDEVKINPVILNQLQRVRSSFGQQIYKGLTFVLADEEIVGNVTKYDGDTIFVKMFGTDDTIIAIELREVLDIKWRGRSLPKN